MCWPQLTLKILVIWLLQGSLRNRNKVMAQASTSQQQGSTPAPTSQQQGQAPVGGQQQGQTVFRDWAAI